MFKSTITIVLATALATGAATQAKAWTSFGSWDSNLITLRASSVSFPSGNAYRTALGTVADRFYNNPSESWIEITYGDTSIGIDNGQNEVWFSASTSYRPALTTSWVTGGGEIVESDVVFYSGNLENPDSTTDEEYWTTSMSKSFVKAYDTSTDLQYRTFETSCLHEFGHAAGLDHENDEYNLMGQSWNHIYCNGSTCRSGVGEDYADGLVDIYGRASGGVWEDVGATLFKYLGTSGAYSTHQKCKMYTTGGTALSSSDTYNYQVRYAVTKGSSYQVEFTYENNGETTQTRTAGFYISTNNTISTSDDLIATDSMELGRGNVYTKKTTVTIPADLTSGTTYYLGVIIDYDSALAEVDGSNNAAYHVIKIN